jgi:hypothetical protein
LKVVRNDDPRAEKELEDGVTAFQIVKSELQHIGYSGDLLQENYVFDDASISQTKELQVPLAAFAQWPPSYRSACIGVLQANGHAGPQYVSSYHALGAPMFFEVYKDRLIRYRIETVGKAINLETIPSHNIPKAFEENRDKWSPTAVFRAKAISPVSVPLQLDFVDAGFFPALKGMIHGKLDHLLKETLHEAVAAHKEATSGSEPDNTALFRLVFRFLAAKIFNDKRHKGDWSSPDAESIIDKVQKFYGLYETQTAPMIDEPNTRQTAWDRLRKAFNFQNLSVEDLAFIYENTLVRRDTRREFGIHSTPSVIAELMVDRLPFEELPQDNRFVLEPCAGHGVFLVAALRRMRDLLPASWTAGERHVYLKERLKAIEVDTFATEVCRLSLMLADYPNPDGWKIISQDIFGSDVLERELIDCEIVLCNPPFEDFNETDRQRYGNRIRSVHKPYEILRRVLERPPAILGFVLPKSAIIGGRYIELQGRIASHYTKIETVALPDRVFAFSDQETMLVFASQPDPKQDAKIFTKTFWLREKDREGFLQTGRLPEAVDKASSRAVAKKAHKDLWNPPLWEIWDYISDYPQLREIADVHRGIEWNIPLKKGVETLVSQRPKPGFKKGLERAHGKIEPLWAEAFVYLNFEKRFQRRKAFFLPWDRPKVVVNRHTVSRGPWRIVAVPDKEGLVFRETFVCIWPREAQELYSCAAILNSPMVNAFLFAREGKRQNRVRNIKDLPIPDLERIERKRIEELIQRYILFRKNFTRGDNIEEVTTKGVDTFLLIDSLILKAYDLPPRLERKLLDFFRGYPRPVPFPFPDYFSEDFQPCIPLHKYLEMDMKRASAGELLKRVTPLDSEEIHEFVLDIEERQTG